MIKYSRSWILPVIILLGVFIPGIIVADPAINLQLNEYDFNLRTRFLTTRYDAIENVEQSFIRKEDFLSNFGMLMSKYIENNCHRYDYNTSRNLHESGFIAYSDIPYEIRESHIGMASIHAFKNLVKRVYSFRDDDRDLVRSQSKSEKVFDLNLFFTLKDVRPIFSCNFQMFHEIRFKAYVSPLEGKSLGNLEIPINRSFRLTLDNRLTFDDFRLKNEIVLRGYIKF